MEIKLLSCPLCLQPHFDNVDTLRTQLVNVATSHLTCPVCSETLLGLDKLTIHLFGHVIQVQPPNDTQQQVHNEIDKSINQIASEEQTAHQEPPPTAAHDDHHVRCDICSFTFTDQTILDMHQKLLHQTSPDKRTGVYSYHCHLCSKKFKMRGSLMVHLRVAHYGFATSQQESGAIEAKSEEKAVEEAEIVPLAKKPQTPDNKQWECDVCSKMFTTKYFLKKHKRLHTGEMPYCCTQCNKSFTFQQSYHKHMLYHSSEKPYGCNECGRSFKELSTLQNHARIHSGERPFACETCGKRFRQRVSYLVHRRIHTGVMPYKCTACEKSFRYKVSQRSHKCPMNPPGSVVRVPDVVEKVPAEVNCAEKCILTFDYNTGTINLVPERQASNVEDVVSENNQKNLLSILSPLLPEVASLCINNSPENSLELRSDSSSNERSIEALFNVHQ